MAENEEKDDIETDDTEKSADDKSAEPTGAKKKKRKRAAEDEAAPPKDRNKRVREQAARKMEEAKQSAKSRANRIGATGLDAGEMVDDAMARGFAAFTKWIKANRRAIELGVGLVIVGGAGYAAWDWYATKTKNEASAALMEATKKANGVVEDPADKSSSSEDEARLRDIDPRPRFESYKTMREEALQSYRTAANEYGGRGAGILAKLGEAGVLLERKDYDGAIKTLDEVLATDLAKADESVRMAAKERMGMALEGKGDEAGALAAYKELAGSGLDTYKNLGLYHQARLSLAKGQKDDAKEKLTKLQERLSGKDSPKSAGGERYLTTQVNALMQQIDPSAASMAPSGELTPERLREIQEQLEKLRQNPPELLTPPPATSGSAAAPGSATAPAGSAPAGSAAKPPEKPPTPPKVPNAPAPKGSE